jgi:hypothetical protein
MLVPAYPPSSLDEEMSLTEQWSEIIRLNLIWVIPAKESFPFPANWCVSYCITIAAAVALYLVLWRENLRRACLPLNDVERDKLAFKDLTDVENTYFTYRL